MLLFSSRNLNKLRIKYQLYPKSTKIDAFGRKMLQFQLKINGKAQTGLAMRG